ncbi:MAG TPA: 2-oxoglutarate and iron-dependent oxygenase domain-containing protein [Candidatus Sulfotelmatobacter sp.]|nr:2-oxoglutarate and iron-dependent oxygenase domain-containing protein [Candidatus Sulfotelmatobacter sp.]
MGQVPAFEIGDFYGADPARRQAIGRAIGEACATIGFFQVVGHRVPADLIERVRAVSYAFFDLPPEEKQRYRPPAGVLLRGYTPPETNTLSRSRRIETPPDFRELISAGPTMTGREYPEFPGARMFYNPNIWPERPTELQPVFADYVRAMEDLSRDLMRLFALGLALPEAYFDGKIDHHFGVFHALHYGARRDPPQPGQLRAGAHSDFGSLTVLYPPEGGDGLEVMSPGGEWVAVDPVPGAFVINIGDLMQRWTNDRWKSTLHRVVNPSDTAGWQGRRLSLGFFCHPNYDADVACLPSCLAEGERPKYDDILAGEYMRQKIMAVRHVSAI